MPLIPCLDCGTLSPKRRCPRCTTQQDRATTQAKREVRPYTHEERVRRAEAVATYRDIHGDVCPGYERPPHAADQHNPLTADHPIGVGAGGDEGQSLTVLCRRCNGAKGAR